MQFFEILLLIITLSLLVSLCFLGRHRKLQQIIFYIGLGSLILHMLFEIVRWQMLFSFLIFAISSLFLLKQFSSHLMVRLLGFITGVLFISTSSFYVFLMPIMKLPDPSGKYIVGSANYTITDLSRLENNTEDPNDKRVLFAEVWYPGSLDGLNEVPPVRTLWEELYKGESDRVSFFMNYLKGINTHSYPDIPAKTGDGTFPVILFNHGLQMFTSQSTLLMEHLASNGYIVVSVAHPYESIRVNLQDAGTVMPDFISSRAKFNEALKWIEKSSAPINAAKSATKKKDNREERAQIMLKAIEESEMNNVVSEWEKDNRFILNELISSGDKELVFRKIMDTSRIGIMGMSVGGAAATEVAKSDKRIKAGINVDGLQYGKRNKEPLEVPFAMIYSEDGKGLNEFLMLSSKNDYFEYTFIGSHHADFTDMTMIWPFMRIYGQLGNIPGERMVELSNKVILNFWDAYLKNKPFKNLNEIHYPELEMNEKFKS